ncbi:hypothetical protein [Hydrogenophaga sp. 2FB]|uniref:hypothetical protein n=1 Tax=Hydrogenophaga sp. 2FB TaxID=2502187 RepID=UPI0010F77841|nr:hypothetical protein [Hydrogenophaga sp. 2FB]
MTELNRLEMLQGMNDDQLCRAYNNQLIGPKTERQLQDVLRSKGISRCEARSRTRVIPQETPPANAAAHLVDGVPSAQKVVDHAVEREKLRAAEEGAALERERQRDEAKKREADRVAAETRVVVDAKDREAARARGVAQAPSANPGRSGSSGGHNGIRFDMSRAEVERMGFVCRESTEAESSGNMRCVHMEMTGRAFSKDLERYKVDFDRNGAMTQIVVDLRDPPTNLSAINRLVLDIREFYPLEYKSPPEYTRLMPFVYRYYESEGSGVQFGYFARSRSASMIFFPKGFIKP